jgi:tetratricopeptide (TPR) repeat protein
MHRVRWGIGKRVETGRGARCTDTRGDPPTARHVRVCDWVKPGNVYNLFPDATPRSAGEQVGTDSYSRLARGSLADLVRHSTLSKPVITHREDESLPSYYLPKKQLPTMVAVAKDAAKNEIASFSAKASKLKHEGDVFFVQKRVGEALVSYEKALRLSLSGSEEKAALHANRAACYLMQNKLSLAVSEATAALENAPTWKPALMRRAKALEQIGHNEKAAADYERAFRIDGNEETRRKMITAKTNAAKEKEKSKKELRGLGPGSGLTGGANRRPVDRRAALLAQQQAAQQQRQLEQRNAPTLTLAVTFDGSLKNFTVPLASVTYLQILAAAKSAFTEKLGDNEHIALKFLDPEGTLVTVTSRSDLRYALAASQSLAARTAAASGAPQAAPDSLVPVRLEVVVVDRTPSETPDQITPANVGSPDSSPSDGDPPAEDVIEIDEWLLTFAALFRKHLGVARETSGPLDLRVVGLEKCCEALEEAVGTDEAKGLLKSAAEKFQEAAAAAVFNWGNVHVCASRKLVDTRYVLGLYQILSTVYGPVRDYLSVY